MSTRNRSKHYFSDSDNDLDGSKASPASTKMSTPTPRLEPINSQSADSSEHSPGNSNGVDGAGDGRVGPSSRFTFENENDDEESD